MHSWHDINPERIKPEQFLALIEIPKGCKNKYELDKETGQLILDRVLSTSTTYPHNYGFIPLTLAKDKDPLDVLVVCSESIFPMSFVNCKPIGVLTMNDSGCEDEKIIAVPLKDPFYSSYDDFSQLPFHIIDEIKHFFAIYKTLEGKFTEIEQVQDSECAKKIIQECMERYNEKFKSKKKWLYIWFI